jgi:hypothetical protein
MPGGISSTPNPETGLRPVAPLTKAPDEDSHKGRKGLRALKRRGEEEEHANHNLG